MNESMPKRRLQELFGDDPLVWLLDRWRALPPPAERRLRRPRPRVYERVPLLHFERLTTADRAFVSALGAGFEARVRPLGIPPDEEHALFVVSPVASFVLVGFGAHYNMTALAGDYATRMDGEPFAVRVRGERFELEYVRIPGVAGHVRTPIGDILLCLLGNEDVALIQVNHHVTRWLARGTATAVNDLELLPDEVPPPRPERPRPFTCERIAEAIARQPTLEPTICRHLTELARSARDELGTECARHLVWALVAAHAQGHNTPVVGTPGEVFQWVLEQGYMRSPPRERAIRGALRWLAARSPLFERTIVNRAAIWIGHVEWFTEPSEACLAAIAGGNDRPDRG